MDTKQEHLEALNFMQAIYETPRAKAILDFAMKRGLEKAVVTCPDGTKHAAAMYAWQLNCNTDAFASSASNGVLPLSTEVETYQVVCIMSALEESATDVWSYGTKLLYDMRKAGVGPTRREYTIFLALEGGWDNPEKSALLEADDAALYFYAGKLQTLCGTLPGIPHCFRKENGNLTVLPEPEASPAATITKLAMKYIPECVGQDNALKVAGILKMLSYRSDFYTAVNPGDYEEGSLAQHTVDVIYKLVQLAMPVTDEQVGLCVLAGLGHDLAEIKLFNKDKEGNLSYDPMPYGHGRKSVYILGGYLGDCLPQSVACAIDVHMNDMAGNPYSHLQMMEEPLGLFLHIADVLAAYNKTKNTENK